MKIHIIGPSGSGKSYLARKLSRQYSVPAWSLDDLFWDNNGYSGKRAPEERDAMLEKILCKEQWIIEGVQHSWVGRAFEEADVIVLLEPPALLCRIRIIRRFIHRKISHHARKNEDIKSLTSLLKWTKKFYKVNLPEIKAELEPYSGKTVCLTRKRDIDTFCRKLKEGKAV